MFSILQEQDNANLYTKQADLDKAGFFKSLVQKIKMALRKCGFNAKWTDNEIKTLLRRSLAKQQRERKGTGTNGENGTRFAIANDESLDLEVRQAFPKYHAEDAKEVLKNLAGKDLKNNDTGVVAKINSNQYNKMISNAAVNKSLSNGFTRDEHFETLANIEDLYQNAVLLEKTEDLKNNDPNVKIYRFASPFVIGNEIADALIIVKETINIDQKRIYTLELTEIKKPSGEATTIKNADYRPDGINKLHQKHEKIKSFFEKNQENLRFSLKDGEKSENFKKWFGDSKIVDENGEPLVVYHGTNGLFTKFKKTKNGYLGPGIYFVNDKKIAERYTDFGDEGIMVCYYQRKVEWK